MKVDFYYWSYQCPLNNVMIELLREYEDKLEIIYHDISKDFLLAERMNMFFPTLTVVNDEYRYFSPLSSSFLDSLCKGEIPTEEPYRPMLGTKEKNIIIEPIKRSNYLIAGECTGQKCTESCVKKIEFFEKENVLSFGYINIDESNNLLGGAEYVPSVLVPYRIPKDEKTAFLTCLYLSDSEFDYKSGPLMALEKDLSLEYDKIIVISDEMGVFPNGDLSFFIKNGYEDEGIISQEKDYCTLHLLSKSITR